MSAHSFVYVIQNNMGRFYIGLSDGLEKRVSQHNNNESTWTRGKGPWLLVWSKGPMALSEARKLEGHLKQQKGGNVFFQATGLPRTSAPATNFACGTYPSLVLAVFSSFYTLVRKGLASPPMTATASRKQLSPAWILTILTGLNLFNYLDRFVLSAVLTPLQKDLGINDGQAGRLVTAFMIGYFVTSPFFGWLGDRCSRKWLIAAGIFVWSLGTILTGFAATFAMMIGFRVLVGLGEASYATISPSLISDTYAPAKRNNALTIFYVAIPVGAALGTILGGFIAARWGWRHAFIWAGAPGLLLALVMLPFAEVKRGQAEGKSAEASKRPSVRDILNLFRIPSYVLVLLGYTAYTFALGAFGHWGPTFLHRTHGVAVEKAGGFFGAVLVVAGLVGTLLGGFAATAWQKRNRAGYAWTLGLAVLVAVPLSFGAFLATSTFWSMALLAAAMFFLFLPTGPVNTLILESAPVNLRASAMAVSIFTIHLFGDMWSPEIVGRLADSFGGNLQKAVLILPVALMVASALWLVLAVKTKRDSASKQTETPQASTLQ